MTGFSRYLSSHTHTYTHTQPGRVDLNHPKICGHKGPVLDVQWNPFDDNEIASASEDCEIKLWTIPDGGITKDYEAKDAKAVLSGHERKVMSNI